MATVSAELTGLPQPTRLACYGRPIPPIRRIGSGAGLAITLLASSPTTAWSALSSHVAVHGPRRVNAGRPVPLKVDGYAGRGARTLVVWLDTNRCARTDRAEDLRGPRLPPPAQYRVSGSFVVNLTVKRSVPGTHYACAYVTRHRTGRTVARASWRYVTRRR